MLTKENKEMLAKVMQKTEAMPDGKRKIMLWVGTGMDLANTSQDDDPDPEIEKEPA